MFQVSGESMLQLGGGGLHDGDIVIGQYLEDIFSLRDNRVYVIISTEVETFCLVLNVAPPGQHDDGCGTPDDARGSAGERHSRF